MIIMTLTIGVVRVIMVVAMDIEVISIIMMQLLPLEHGEDNARDHILTNQMN